tara:strand:+ start:957 stop:1166 length:210 start_codon:yes stop_codon:yes gene_type:complete
MIYAQSACHPGEKTLNLLDTNALSGYRNPLKWEKSAQLRRYGADRAPHMSQNGAASHYDQEATPIFNER